ncbi:hypothetical protein GPX89_24970 [Nocardia sp. ET3-3]|uniref:SRPBCC family protein n=1 Tax=Nocardia terrae TaxID=2675851 RepID=A0A7K1V2Y0_9NOCA|nr:hypothetical protein [Nocardia terrae]MVU80488.1 hypothetical protein [Nocardia terrae]
MIERRVAFTRPRSSSGVSACHKPISLEFSAPAASPCRASAYDHLTTVDIAPVTGGVQVTMTIEPMHDEEWTRRIVAGRANELDNLGKVIASE